MEHQLFNFHLDDNYSDPAYIGSKFRKKRFYFFEKMISNLDRPLKILDLGGTVNFWKIEQYQKRNDVEICVLNLITDGEETYNIKQVKGDACDLSQFKDQEFDVVFSNSLIEHLSSSSRQYLMAREAQRVGKYFFIQTPNRYFPIEPHYKFPFLQFLPKEMLFFLLTRTTLIRGKKYPLNLANEMIKEIKLLSRREIEQLFPGSHLYTEKFLSIHKSYIAHNFPDFPSSN